jgi:hypothetical protein
VIVVVVLGVDTCFGGLLFVFVRGSMVRGRWRGGRGSRPMHHGVGVEVYLVLVLRGVTGRQVFVEFRFWKSE